jgi:hypothetical protein
MPTKYKFNVGRIIGKGDERKFDLVFSIELFGNDQKHAMRRVNEMVAGSGMTVYPVNNVEG